MRIRNVLITFTQFPWVELDMDEQEIVDYSSKYQDLYDKARLDHQKEEVSILNDIDFELELIHRDDVNVAYILKLLGKLKDADEAEHEKQRKAIMDLVADSDDISETFESFLNIERIQAFEALAAA